jgi:hypothetical protein
MIRKSIFYLFGTTILIAIGDAQPPAGSFIPPDSEIRGILMQRASVARTCSVGPRLFVGNALVLAPGP